MLEHRHIRALEVLCARLDSFELAWVVTGSCGLALQGLPVTVDDIDLQTDQAGAYKMAHIFADHMVRPMRHTHTNHIQSHFGAFTLGAVEVEIMGAVQYRAADGTWGPAVSVLDHRHYVRFQDHTIPVLTLEYERLAYANHGRTEKAKLVDEWLGDQA